MKKIKRLNIPLALLAAVFLSAAVTMLQILIQVSDSEVIGCYFKAPLLFLFNTLPVFLCIVLFYFLFNNLWSGFTVASVAVYILVTVNHYKVYFRDEPFTPNDLNLFNETFNIMKNYDITLSTRVLYGGIIFLLLIALTCIFIRAKKNRLWVRAVGVAVTVLLMWLSVNNIYHNQWLFDRFETGENYYNDVSVNNSRGMVYNFLYKTTGVYYRRPEGYSPKKASQLLQSYGSDYSESQKLPNVIAIMSEAFFDLSSADNINYYNGMDPMKAYNLLKKDALYGNIIVPGFAGGTAATEFEFLSGANLSLVDTALPTVYKTHITKSMYCLPQALNELGYRSIAIHPGDRKFYNRHNVYERMGFSEFITKEDMPDTELVNWYVSDKDTSDRIIDEYKKHLSENPEQPYFNFTVTIQNHGPYSKDDSKRSLRVKPINGLDKKLYNVLNNYADGLSDAVALLTDVKEYAESIDRPTVIVFFGDHLPYLDGEMEIYDKIGYDMHGEDVETIIKEHKTPFIIWGNSAAHSLSEEKKLPVQKGDAGDISTNFLPVLLMKYMNMQLPPYFGFVDDVFSDIQCIAGSYCIVNGKIETQPDGSVKDKLKSYKILQYNNMRNYKLKGDK